MKGIGRITELHRITTVHAGEGQTLHVTYTDGVSVHIDLAPLIEPGTVFAVLADPELFRAAEVGSRGRSVVWTGGLDLDADALRLDPEESGAGHVLLGRTPPLPANTVSAEIARALRDSGLTQRALAGRMGTTQSAVSRLLSPHYHGQTVGALERLADALGMDLEVRLLPKAGRRAS